MRKIFNGYWHEVRTTQTGSNHLFNAYYGHNTGVIA